MRKFSVAIIICCVLAGSAFPFTSRTQILDKFGDVCCDDEKARLDNFHLALQNSPQAQGYIIFYGGKLHNYPACHSSQKKPPRRGESEARAARLKDYLIRARGLDPNRVIVINGGYRESWEAELWVVPRGESAPPSTPTLKPEEIKFRKGKIKKSDYECEV